MTSAEINRLPTVLYRQVINLEEDEAETAADETPACAICMEKFADGDVQRNLPCFHMFHKNCVDVWLKVSSFLSCPIQSIFISAKKFLPRLSRGRPSYVAHVVAVIGQRLPRVGRNAHFCIKIVAAFVLDSVKFGLAFLGHVSATCNTSVFFIGCI